MERKSEQTLGKLGLQLLAFTQLKDIEILYIGDAQRVLNISSKQENDLLSRLCKSGFIIRLKRGVYLVPKKIPPGGRWQPSAYYLISYLMEIESAHYYIGGLNALHHHGLIEQVPNTITVYNDKISGKRQLGKLTASFIKTSKKKIGATITVRTKNNRATQIASLTRTIIDSFNDANRFNTLPQAYKWIYSMANDKKFLKKLVEVAIQYGNVSTRRRIGYFLSVTIKLHQTAAPILASLKTTKNWVTLNPNESAKGKTNKTWRIIDNVNHKYFS